MELWKKTAREILGLLVRRELSAEEVTKYYLERIERIDPKLNSVACLNPNALQEARELDQKGPEGFPLFGLTVLIKDNIDVAELPTTAGSKALAENIVKKDAPLVSRLRQAGAVILGKTNMTEFANYTTQGMPGGYSSYAGQVVNAYDEKHTPLGSSSGSAVAMSAGLCSAAVGTDTCFSVVACAGENGVTGVKPIHGAISTDGIVPISHTLDSAGMLTRDLKDAFFFLDVLRDHPCGEIKAAEPEQLRVAVNTCNRDMVSGEQLHRYKAYFEKIKQAGVRIYEISQPYCPEVPELMKREFMQDLERYFAWAGNTRYNLRDIIDCYQQNPEEMMKYGIVHLLGALEAGCDARNEEILSDILRHREGFQQQLTEETAPYDACLMTGAVNLMHYAGIASLSFPFDVNENGLPRSLILYGADEKRLYSAALALEKYAKDIPFPNLSNE